MKRQKLITHRWTFLLAAAVAAVFAAIACVLMFADFAIRQSWDPLESPEYVAYKSQLRQQPDDEAVKQKLRDLDLELRQQYFRHRHFANRGAWLLLGTVGLAVLAARSATTIQRRLPAPSPPPDEGDWDTQVERVSLWSVLGLAAVLVCASCALFAGYRSVLPRDMEGLAAILAPDDEPPPDTTDAVADNNAEQPAPASTQDETLPTAAEIAENWHRFRGPGGTGIATTSGVPETWDGASGEGILAKTAVPLPGYSSPILWGNQLFLTGADEAHREVYCFDTEKLDLQWQFALPDSPSDAGEPLEVSEDTGFAASTATTDGRRVYAIFANGDLAALDLAGQQVWLKHLGHPQNPYGHASSLIVHEGLLFVLFDQGTKKDDLSRLFAMDARTGDTVWEVTREVPSSWATPIVIVHDEKPQLITCADPWVTAYNPADGSEIWKAKCLRQDVGPSPVFVNGTLYVTNEFPGTTAIRVDGQGDVTETHVVWEAEFGSPDTCTPLITEEFVLLLASYGTLTCYDAAEAGEPLWEQDFDDGFRSSPGQVGKHVYLVGETGAAWVVEPTREECRTVAEADLGEECFTSPAFRDGRMYIRGKEHVFCIGAK